MASRSKPQMPTAMDVRVKSIEEAHLVFHTVKLSLRPTIQHRLAEDERWSIKEGSVFVWEERDEQDDPNGSAISRWTDGRRWGPSRVKDEFLIYRENLPQLPEGHSKKDEDEYLATRLIKQTYSAWVQVGGRRRKWHLVAYYTEKTKDRLARVSDVQVFAQLRGRLPPDAYVSARAPKTRGRSNSNLSDDGGDTEPTNDSPTSPALPAPTNEPSYDILPPNPPASGIPPRLGHDDPMRPFPPRDALHAIWPATPSDAGTGSPTAPRLPERHQAQPAPRGRGGGAYALAPLVYDRLAPYPPRHPVDSYALRSLDVRVRIT